MSVGQVVRQGAWLRLLIVLVCVLVVLGLVWVWHDPAWRSVFNPQGLSALGHRLLASPLGPVAVIGGYVLAVSLAVPVVVLVSVGSLIFGVWPGMAYAMAGMLAGALFSYGAGRLAGAALVDRAAGGRLSLLSRHLGERRNLWTVVLVRVLPVAPFLVVNVAAGALGLRLRDFLLGSFIGLLPATILISLFLDRLSAAWASPGLLTYAMLGGLVLVVILSAWWLRRRLSRVG